MKDILRPLNKRGQKNVPRMGERLKEAQIIPQLILSSPAERARQTAQGVAKKVDYFQDIVYYDSFYMGEPDDYLKKLVKVPDTVERVLVIGHNPGLEGLMQILSQKVEALPTASIAFISLPIEHWKDLNDHVEGSLNEIWRPKNLDAKS